MQVQNTTARAIRLPGRVDRSGDTVRLVNHGLGRNLVPGDNFVADAEWAEAKKAKLVRMCLATDPPMLREGTGRLPEEDLPAGQILDAGPLDNLLSLDRTVAKAKIADCGDSQLLTQWAAADNRKPIIEHIEKRLAELS